MSMKVTLHKEETYTAVVGERTLHGCTRETWHGIDRLLDPQGRELVLNNGAVVRGSAALLTDLGLLEDTGFVRIPARTLPNGTYVPEFQVAQRKCSKGDDGKIVIDAARAPWVNIDYFDAIKACEAAGQKLLTGEQSLSIALDIAEQNINWTGGKVAQGKVYQGLHKGTVRGPQVGIYESPNAEERRWHQLSTGERIYDFAGHTWEWMRDTFHSDGRGVIASNIPADSPYLTVPPYASCEKGMGWRPTGGCDWSGYALLRGGYWSDVGSAGVFYLNRTRPEYRDGDVGFRSTK